MPHFSAPWFQCQSQFVFVLSLFTTYCISGNFTRIWDKIIHIPNFIHSAEFHQSADVLFRGDFIHPCTPFAPSMSCSCESSSLSSPVHSFIQQWMFSYCIHCCVPWNFIYFFLYLRVHSLFNFFTILIPLGCISWYSTTASIPLAPLIPVVGLRNETAPRCCF